MPSLPLDGRLRTPLAPPMQAREVRALPCGEDWVYEFLWGGERVRVIKNGESVHIASRDGRDFTNRFPRVAASAARLRSESVVLDGEVLYLDSYRPGAVSLLARACDESETPRLVMLAYDLLLHAGRDVRHFSLLCRRLMLASAVQGTTILMSPVFSGPADAAVTAAARLGLPGVVAKRGGSAYRPNSVHSDWVKVTLTSRNRSDAGYTAARNAA